MDDAGIHGYTGFILVGIILLFPLLYTVGHFQSYMDFGWGAVFALLLFFGVKVALYNMRVLSNRQTSLCSDIQSMQQQIKQ